MTKLLMSELCTMRKGQTINEVDIYNLKGADITNAVPIISSSTMNSGIMGYIDKKHINLYKKIGRSGDLSWVTNGYAGKVTYRETDFLPTEKCGVAAIKTKYKKLVDPKWLEIYLNSITKKYVVAKEGNGKLEIVQMKNIPVVIPSSEEQLEIIKEYVRNQNIISNLENKLADINDKLLNIANYKSKKYKISDLFQITSGIRITKEEVYANQGTVPVITSQSKREGIAWFADRKWLKTYLKKDRPVLINQECISWTKEGNAGKMFFRDFEFFPIDVAGVLILKENIQINLKWFISAFQNVFYSHVVSKGGQGKLYEEQMANIEVEIPVKDNGEIDMDIQNEIYAEYKRLSDIKEKLESIVDNYSL